MITIENRETGVSILTLDNPPLNLNTLDTIREINAQCTRIASDTSIRVLIITGAGHRAFCAGSDIKEFEHVRDDVVGKKLRAENEAFTSIERLPQPTIAALNGHTIGGGAEIALACDFRIIDEQAKIGFPEIDLGVFPGGGGIFRLPRLVGQAKALELLYTGELIDADEALRIGLVNSVVPSGGTLEAAHGLAARLITKPALALGMIKNGVRESFEQTVQQATALTLADSARVFSGEDVMEGITAFFAKRRPQFRHPTTENGKERS
jgi:enoyl-CoA hydratase/carnithine racemase